MTKKEAHRAKAAMNRAGEILDRTTRLDRLIGSQKRSTMSDAEKQARGDLAVAVTLHAVGKKAPARRIFAKTKKSWPAKAPFPSINLR